jgi:hypothetical protein
VFSEHLRVNGLYAQYYVVVYPETKLLRASGYFNTVIGAYAGLLDNLRIELDMVLGRWRTMESYPNHSLTEPS